MLPLLQGRVLDPDHDFAQLAAMLRGKLDAAESDNDELREQLEDERRKNRSLEKSVAEIRRQLLPLHSALCGLFGEIGNFAPGESPAEVDTNPKRRVWESWIQKFGAASLNGRMIVALLDHHQMTAPQLRVAMQCGNQSVYDTATRLNKLGLLEKNGGKYSLKSL